jgi:hypothetical protein
LIKWINAHPFKENPDAPLWIIMFKNGYGNQLTYYSARKMVMKRCEKAGLSKRIYLNLFRHSEATRSAQYMTDAQMKKRHGWSARSNMTARYVHMQDQDVENAILSHYGISKGEQEKPKSPVKCQACGTINSPDVRRCESCARPLDLKAALEIEDEISTEKEVLQKQFEELKVQSKTDHEVVQSVYKFIETFDKAFLKPNGINIDWTGKKYQKSST